MPEPLVNDELWAAVEPILPAHPPSPKGGAPRKPDRPCLEGVIHVLSTGCQWQSVRACDAWPSGSTCWRRFDEWTAAGCWPRLHRALLDGLGVAGLVDLTTVVADSATVRAEKGGRTPDRARSTGGKRAANATSWATPTACPCWS